MNFYIYLRFLIAELLVVGSVVLIFRTIEDRTVAGATAGTVFVLLGLYILINGLRVKTIRKSATFVLGMVHLFAVALPLMSARLLNHQAAFSDVKVWGMAGPVFHRLSTGVYLALVIATAIDMVRSRRSERKAAKLF